MNLSRQLEEAVGGQELKPGVVIVRRDGSDWGEWTVVSRYDDGRPAATGPSGPYDQGFWLMRGKKGEKNLGTAVMSDADIRKLWMVKKRVWRSGVADAAA